MIIVRCARLRHVQHRAEHLSVTRAATALFAVPVVALFMGWGLLGERPSRLGVLGGSLALAGVPITARERSRV